MYNKKDKVIIVSDEYRSNIKKTDAIIGYVWYRDEHGTFVITDNITHIDQFTSISELIEYSNTNQKDYLQNIFHSQTEEHLLPFTEKKYRQIQNVVALYKKIVQNNKCLDVLDILEKITRHKYNRLTLRLSVFFRIFRLCIAKVFQFVNIYIIPVLIIPFYDLINLIITYKELTHCKAKLKKILNQKKYDSIFDIESVYTEDDLKNLKKEIDEKNNRMLLSNRAILTVLISLLAVGLTFVVQIINIENIKHKTEKLETGIGILETKFDRQERLIDILISTHIDKHPKSNQ